VLFGGDPLSFVSRHHFPALMHQPDGPLMASHAPSRRLSMPFFLYCDDDAVLDAGLARGSLRALAPLPRPSRLPMRHLKLNVGGCRQSWPWKAQPYYDGLVLADDANPFPGELTQYELRPGYESGTLNST
jgi:hypothetical protein